jgi:hypothetical protein
MTVTQLLPGAVSTAVAALADEQWRVAGLVDSALHRGVWDVRLPPEQRRRLVRLGHFPAFAAELDWSPGEVAGHLRDSARVFADRIQRMRSELEPPLADFVTTSPERLLDYRTTSPAVLTDQLRAAQAKLLQTVADVRADDLDRVGRHEVDGPVTVAGLLDFLPGHQRDHADQLSALVQR